MKEKETNYFVRTLIVLLCIGISFLIAYNFLYTCPKGEITGGLITLIIFLLVLVLAESFDNFSVGKLLSIKREIAKKVEQLFDMRPFAIENRLKLRNPIYLETAAYGHMGKESVIVTKVFESPYNGRVEKEVELFTWEKLDKVDDVKKAFNM